MKNFMRGPQVAKSKEDMTAKFITVVRQGVHRDGRQQNQGTEAEEWKMGQGN